MVPCSGMLDMYSCANELMPPMVSGRDPSKRFSDSRKNVSVERDPRVLGMVPFKRLQHKFRYLQVHQRYPQQCEPTCKGKKQVGLSLAGRLLNVQECRQTRDLNTNGAFQSIAV